MLLSYHQLVTCIDYVTSVWCDICYMATLVDKSCCSLWRSFNIPFHHIKIISSAMKCWMSILKDLDNTVVAFIFSRIDFECVLVYSDFMVFLYYHCCCIGSYRILPWFVHRKPPGADRNHPNPRWSPPSLIHPAWTSHKTYIWCAIWQLSIKGLRVLIGMYFTLLSDFLITLHTL